MDSPFTCKLLRSTDNVLKVRNIHSHNRAHFARNGQQVVLAWCEPGVMAGPGLEPAKAAARISVPGGTVNGAEYSGDATEGSAPSSA